MTDVRQRLLVLHLARPDLASSVAAWAWYDGTGKERHSSGDSDSPPYDSVVHAMQDGWRVIQFPALTPPYPGAEYQTSFLKYEYILEKMEAIDE
jgi:hypothetical protein